MTLLLAAGVGAAILGLDSGTGPAQIVREQRYGMDRRIVVFTLRGWSVESHAPYNNRVQARLGNRWTEPTELFGQGGEVGCIVPLQADRCRLSLRAQRHSPSDRASTLFERCGLAKRLPNFCGGIICRLPAERPPVRDITTETALPRMAHNLSGAPDPGHSLCRPHHP